MGKWEMVRLGDVCEIVSGTTPSTNKPELWGGNIKWITPAEITNDSYFIYDTERHITEKAGLKQMPAGTVLLSSRAPIGKVAIAANPMCCNQGFKNLICSDKIHNRYLYRYLKNQTANLNSLGRGSTFKEISKPIVEAVEIPLPPLAIQQKIADILDHANALIEKRRAQIEKLDLLVKSHFVEMFGDPVTNPMGWEVRKLAELSTLITKGSSPNWQGINYVDDKNQVLFITSENVREGFLDLSKEKHLENRFNDIQTRSILQKNDVLINIVGASIGRAAVYDRDEKANINQAVALVRCTDIVNIDYLCLYLNSPKALQMYGEMQVDAARANLSLKNIADLQIMFPPLALQNQFAAFLAQVEAQKAKLKKSLALLELNYKSLMQKCFKGEMF